MYKEMYNQYARPTPTQLAFMRSTGMSSTGASRTVMSSTGWLIASLFGLLIAASLFTAQPALAAKSTQRIIKGARIHQQPSGTRLVLESSGATDFKVFALDNPRRVVVDIKNARLKTDLNKLALSKTPIKKIRHGIREGHHLRIVLDVNQKVSLKRLNLAANAKLPHRLVVDLGHKAASSTKAPNKKVIAKASASKVPVKKVLTQQSPARKPSKSVTNKQRTVRKAPHPKRRIVIAVDAGHGGHDPGALGPKKLKEKDVVLAITKALGQEINREPGYIAKLVRSGDRYVPHRERSGFARKARADLFVSIHADAFTNPKAHGASVFALSKSGSTSETARVLAKSQNQNLLLGGDSTLTLGDKAPDLQKVLVDLSMNATLDASLEVGADVLREMGKVARLHKKRVEQASFLVLKSTDMPSILVETGFISNPREAKNLSSPVYRRKLAKQIFKGIKAYFERNPPPQSYVAWRQGGGNGQEVVIARGDTLSRIAARYDVSVKELRRHNGLKNDTIRVGQRIKIPLG